MKDKRQITVPQMQPGQSGRVIQILGGHSLVNRLNSLGIIPGKRITKVSAMFMRGPVTLQVGRAQVAIGFGMAGRIMVEVD
ncbi:MAG: ferrous iron transport protein A [Dehalococcoidia bacterium]|nr:ferrous iron transport protein A [Dehalococcoidia bacterium]